MEISYTKDSCRKYLCAKIIFQADSYEERMLGSLDSPFFLPFTLRYEDEAACLQYDITGKISLADLCAEQDLACTAVKNLILCLYKAVNTAGEFLLDADDFSLEPERIFYDPDRNSFSFLYLPSCKEGLLAGLKDITAMLLEKADYSDPSLVLLVYEFYRTVRKQDFEMEDLPRLLNKGWRTEPRLDSGREGDAFPETDGQEETYRPESDRPEEFSSLDDIQKTEADHKRKGELPGESLKEWLADKKGHRLFTQGYSPPLAMMGICLLMLILYRAGLMNSLAESSGSALSPEMLTVVLMAIACTLSILAGRLKGAGKRMKEKRKKDKDNEFWGDLLERQYVYDEDPEEEPPKKHFLRRRPH